MLGRHWGWSRPRVLLAKVAERSQMQLFSKHQQTRRQLVNQAKRQGKEPSPTPLTLIITRGGSRRSLASPTRLQTERPPLQYTLYRLRPGVPLPARRSPTASSAHSRSR